MAKTLCDWSKKEIERNSEKLLELVAAPSFFCRKCARVANNPRVLCGAKRFFPKEAVSGATKKSAIAHG